MFPKWNMVVRVFWRQIAEGGSVPWGFGRVYDSAATRYYAVFPVNYLIRFGLWLWWGFHKAINRPTWIDKLEKKAYTQGYWMGREVEKTVRETRGNE